MTNLTKPTCDSEIILRKAVKQGKAKATKNYVKRVTASFAMYDSAAGNLTQFTPLDLPETTRNLFKGLVTRFSGNGVLGNMYDELTEACLLCPMCCLNEASELDHYLPKDTFAEFTTYAMNLVPICSVCNKQKGSDSSALFFHSYFDEEADYEYLACSISVRTAGVFPKYSISLDSPRSLASRKLRHQFDTVLLLQRYDAYALDWIANSDKSMARIFLARGAAGVKAALKDALSTRELEGVKLNDWKAILLRSLIHSREYCQRKFTS